MTPDDAPTVDDADQPFADSDDVDPTVPAQTDSVADDAAADGQRAADADADLAADLQCLCPLGGVMDLLSRTHAMQVICAVGYLEPARYGEIEDALGEVSSSTLSARLEELTEAGLLARERYDEIPPRVEYELTDDGGELAELLGPLLAWAESRTN